MHEGIVFEETGGIQAGTTSSSTSKNNSWLGIAIRNVPVSSWAIFARKRSEGHVRH